MLHERAQAGRRHPFHCDNVKRKYDRCTVLGLACDITDKALAYACNVKDISLGGFKLVDVPLVFSGEKHTYTLLITSNRGHYRIIAKPCWQKREGQLHTQEVGFKILDAPLDWVSYAMEVTQHGTVH